MVRVMKQGPRMQRLAKNKRGRSVSLALTFLLLSRFLSLFRCFYFLPTIPLSDIGLNGTPFGLALVRVDLGDHLGNLTEISVESFQTFNSQTPRQVSSSFRGLQSSAFCTTSLTDSFAINLLSRYIL
jgi:hypothetical protein